MEKLISQKTLGLVLCTIFAVPFFSTTILNAVDLFHLYGYFESKIQFIIASFFELVLFLSYLFVGRKEHVFNNQAGRFCAFALALISFVYVIVNLGSMFNFNVLSFYGVYVNAVLQSIIFLLTIFFITSVKTWVPVKISWIATMVPVVVYSFFFVNISVDYDTLQKQMSIIGILRMINYILNLITIILTVVWMLRCKQM